MGSGSASVEAFLKAHPELQFVDLLIPDINGIVRGKRVDPSTLGKVFERGIALPASIFALNIQGTTVEETGLGLDIGEADRVCLPIHHGGRGPWSTVLTHCPPPPQRQCPVRHRCTPP